MTNVFRVLSLFTFFLPISALCDTGKVVHGPARGTAEHTFHSNEHVILSCPPGRRVHVESVRWAPILEDNPEHDWKFSRTKHLSLVCAQLENCAFRPVAATVDLKQPFEFLGQPVNVPNYTLNLLFGCTNAVVPRRDRRVAVSYDFKSATKPVLNLGCGEDEVIQLSHVRVSGLGNLEHNEGQYCYKSVFENAHFLCSGKRTCNVPWSEFEGDSNGCDFKEVSLEYYCHKVRKNHFFDPMQGWSKKTVSQDYVLTAQEGSHTVAFCPADHVFHVVSAVWESQEQVDLPANKRNRLELVKFLCEGQSSCSFVPTRAAIGPDERLCHDIVFGGIVKNPDTNFLLRVHLQLKKLDASKYKNEPFKFLEANRQGSLVLECPDKLAPVIAVALWGGVHKDRRIRGNSVNFDDVKWNRKKYKFCEVGHFLNKRCFGKSTCTLYPAKLDRVPTDAIQELPLAAGVPPDEHELFLFYKCVDYSQVPSLVALDGEREHVDGGLFSFAELSDPEALKLTGFDPNKVYPREFVTPVHLTVDTRVTSLLEVRGKSTLNIANILDVEVPFGDQGGDVLVHWKAAELTQKVEVSGNVRDYVFEFILGAADYVRLTVSAFVDEKTAPKTTVLDLEAKKDLLDLTKFVEDVVVAQGGVVSLRAFYQKGQTQKAGKK